jgi:ketosteroid isomerase-like protein
MNAKDKETMAGCYAEDAVAVTPDEGEINGREGITNYLFQLWEAFPDVNYESTDKYETGNVAIDEGVVTGTNTGALKLPNGESLQPTGKKMTVRSCDVVHVEEGRVKTHHFYFDQLEFMAQLGLLPESMGSSMSHTEGR